MIKLVVFDMAGTTIRDRGYVSEALQAALAKVGVTPPRTEIDQLMGYPKPIAIAKVLELHRPELVPQVAAIHDRFVALMIAFYETTPDLAPKPGALETFAALRDRGIKVALDTGFSRPIVTTILARLGWTMPETLDISVASDEVERGRPYPDMIERAMALAGISEPQQVAKVGDTASDIQQGHAAHCRYVVGVTTGVFSAADLAREQPTHLIAELPELLPILGEG